MSIVIVAEKPSVGRDIAAALGARTKGRGFIEGDGVTVTWAIGHLVRLAEPHEIEDAWKTWRKSDLPMLPSTWPVEVQDNVKDQFEVVSRLLNRDDTQSVVCATDAGREGELIFRYIYEKASCKKPVKRLWISSLTPSAIKNGFKNLRHGREFDDLADAAVGRSRADWLVGMNLSRACSLQFGDSLPIGRVQTPTLEMLVRRELEIKNFKPETYKEVKATFRTADAETYEGVWFREGKEESLTLRKRLPEDGADAKNIVAEIKGASAQVLSVVGKDTKRPAPLLYDLTELQRRANRLFGMSAKDTLTVAQALYEKHKLITYPRTDSRHLSHDVAKTLPEVVAAISGRYPGLLAEGTGEALPNRFVSNEKVTDHHAIIPTTIAAQGKSLNAAEEKIYDLICRRLLSAWHDDYVTANTTVVTCVKEHKFHSSGTLVRQQGWRQMDDLPRRAGAAFGKDPADDPVTGTKLPPLQKGQKTDVANAAVVDKETRPPLPHNEASLLTAMETAGRALDERELSDAMRERGLGTPATRAAIIEGLLKRGFIERDRRALRATEKGIRLISLVPEPVKSPRLTGEWEAMLRQMERGEYKLSTFMRGVQDFVTDQVRKLLSAPGQVAMSPQYREARGAGGSGLSASLPTTSAKQKPPSAAPVPPQPAITSKALRELLVERFHIEQFRSHQEEVCRTVAAGNNALLVMPTGSGKSLCYQLPALARRGTGLVVSPLIALMDDQVAKLQAIGVRAERVHSGRGRDESREIMRRYQQGDLDLLYVAPERLALPGFMEFIAAHPPSLVAIDEAHCISHWGHDFRPDYRSIGDRLKHLPHVPVIAVTATATPIVQDDIVAQLGLPKIQRFIRGFRRHNIAIEVVNATPTERMKLVGKVFADMTCRPGIVYNPTRQKAEDTAKALAKSLRAAPYHAGMSAEEREKVQRAFAAGELDVICATVAFGMGVDKADIRTVVHMGLPSSIEAYYQEIGRAGRDGNVSRAILFCSWSDRKTQEFLIDKSYPETATLTKLCKKVTTDWQVADILFARMKIDRRKIDTALEKLLVHGGIKRRADMVSLGDNKKWKASYDAQRKHKVAMLDHLWKFTAGSGCRMTRLVGHFGDSSDGSIACGLCDACAPDSCLVRELHSITPAEQAQMKEIVRMMPITRSLSTGQLYKQYAEKTDMTRGDFEALVAELDRNGFVLISDEHFTKNGRRIDYQKVSLTAKGRTGAMTQ